MNEIDMHTSAVVTEGFPGRWFVTVDGGRAWLESPDGGPVCACPADTDLGDWLATARTIALALHAADAVSPAILAFSAERRRQVEREGWTPAHDDEHADGELAGAAACYARNGTTYKVPERPAKYQAVADARRKVAKDMDTLREAVRMYNERNPQPPGGWPWEMDSWKPTSRKRDIEKAGALLAAEWERLDRLDALDARMDARVEARAAARHGGSEAGGNPLD